jgi:hypothetical protein
MANPEKATESGMADPQAGADIECRYQGRGDQKDSLRTRSLRIFVNFHRLNEWATTDYHSLKHIIKGDHIINKVDLFPIWRNSETPRGNSIFEHLLQ